jgi:hypothetical protein
MLVSIFRALTAGVEPLSQDTFLIPVLVLGGACAASFASGLILLAPRGAAGVGRTRLTLELGALTAVGVAVYLYWWRTSPGQTQHCDFPPLGLALLLAAAPPVRAAFLAGRSSTRTWRRLAGVAIVATAAGLCLLTAYFALWAHYFCWE